MRPHNGAAPGVWPPRKHSPATQTTGKDGKRAPCSPPPTPYPLLPRSLGTAPGHLLSLLTSPITRRKSDTVTLTNSHSWRLRFPYITLQSIKAYLRNKVIPTCTPICSLSGCERSWAKAGTGGNTHCRLCAPAGKLAIAAPSHDGSFQKNLEPETCWLLPFCWSLGQAGNQP